MTLIRLFQQDDFGAVIDLWKAEFGDVPPHNEPEGILKEKLKHDGLIFVALKADRLIGSVVVGYDGHRGWLYNVLVHSEFRRQGIGNELVLRGIEALKQLGCSKVNLQIRADNMKVEKFYAGLGFNTEARISMGMIIEGKVEREL